MKLISLLILFVVFLFSDDSIVKIGVLVKRGIDTTFNRWNETAKYLTKKIENRTFKIVPISFDNIVKVVKNKEIDFILANSGFYVELEYMYGVQRITTLINRPITGVSQKEFGGVIFSHIDNAKRFIRLEDIKGSNFLAVNEKSFGGWQVAWRELAESGIDRNIDLASLKFKETHDSVVYSIINHEGDVGTVRTDILERMAIEDKIDLSKIHIINLKEYTDFPFLVSTRLYPEWPFAKLKHISDKLSKQVAIALMQMQANDFAAINASIYGWATPLNYEQVHSCFKFLKISPYYQDIKFLDVIYKYLYWILFYFLLALIAIGMFIYQFRLTKHLRKTQDELVQTEKIASLGRLVAGVSHEINTPIGISVTAASYLSTEAKKLEMEHKDETLTKDSFEAFIDVSIKSSEYILTNLERVAKLIQNFKQISIDQSSNDVREFNLKEHLDGIITSLHSTINGTLHVIDVVCSKNLRIHSNPSVFYQIFNNLILNSFIHGFENKEIGHITITIDDSNNYLSIIYKDDGKGVPEKDLEKIFDPFFTTKRTIGGSGLGTHIVYNLITQKLKGSIKINSKNNMGLTYNMIFKGILYV